MALATIEQHFDWMRDRLRRTVQTNEPGRSTVLYPALLWLTDEFSLPIRLLEIGASAGLNLLADRYCYVVAGHELGDAKSAVRFGEPWDPGPPIDVSAASKALQIRHKAGCDEHPLDPADPDDRITLLSYIWPDERARLERLAAALEIAAEARVEVTAAAASEWLPGALAARQTDELTVIWESVFRQYVDPSEWQGIEAAVSEALAADRSARIAWLAMEPGPDHLANMQLTLRTDPAQPEVTLASCGDHGPPVVWSDRASEDAVDEIAGGDPPRG